MKEHTHIIRNDMKEHLLPTAQTSGLANSRLS